MKTLHIAIIIILVIAVPGAGIAHSELVPKTLANLYQEYQGKLIVLGQVMSVSENTGKNLTSYDIKILDYVTRPQQASVITASVHTENKTISVFEVGDNVQLYLDKGLTGYEISPYSFKMDKKCTTWFGPSHLSFELPIRGGPASNTRFLDSNGNVISPSLNHEFVLATDGVYTPLDSLGFEVNVSLNDNPNPIFHNTKQFGVKPCTYATPTWKYTPTEYGNYTVFYKVIGGIYQDKIILDNASMTTGFVIEKSNVVQSKNTTNFIGNDLTPILPPLKQFKSGIGALDVTCKTGLQLIIKSEDLSPACVTPVTSGILAKRGWTHDNIVLPKNMSHVVIPPLNDTNSEKPQTTSENKNSSPLQLFLSIDSEYENPGGPISIDVGLNNTASVPLTLEKSDNWPRNDLISGLCSNLPFGISILKGYYTEQNMSSAKSLIIYENVPCPAPTSLKSYTFEPSSSKATPECDTLFSCPGLTDMRAHLVIPDFMYNGQHHSFDVGKYTLVGGDEWGHVMIQHFTEEYATAYSNTLEK